MPKIEFKCNARASLFAYPPPLESKKKEEHEKVCGNLSLFCSSLLVCFPACAFQVETAVLSITHKKKPVKKGGEEKMEVDEEPKPAKDEEKFVNRALQISEKSYCHCYLTSPY